MTSRHPAVLFTFMVGMQILGQSSAMILSSSEYTTVIPTSVPLYQPIVELIVIHQATTSPHDNQSAHTVSCDVIKTSQDGVLLGAEFAPFAIDSNGLYIFAEHSLQSLLFADKDQISYDIIIRCSSSAGETLTTSVLINVTSASRWQHLYCHDVNTTLSAEAVESLCFADGVNQFNIYENTISVLGRVSPPPLYTDMCPHYGEIVSEYTVVTGDVRYNDVLEIENGKLFVIKTLDAEMIRSLETTVTCTLRADQSPIVIVSRDITISVLDTNDCGPVIYTSSGKVKVTERTIAFDKTDKLTFQDGDSDTSVNKYNIQVLDDPDQILEYSQPTIISKRFKLYGFDLRMTSIPLRDFNASIVITDETLTSRDPDEARAIYRIRVKGRKPPLMTSLSEIGTETRPQADGRIFNSLSPTRQWTAVKVDHSSSYINNNNKNNNNNNVNNKNTDTIRASEDHSELRDNEFTHTTEVSDMTDLVQKDRTRISLTKEPSDHYKVNISAAAAKYTRIFEVLLVKAAFSSFQLVSSDVDIPMDISPYSGVIYTTGSLMPYSNKTINVDIRGKAIVMPFSHDLNIHVEIGVQPTELPPSEQCNESCATARSQSSCESMCGYGASSGRCVWRPADGASHYSTCVPSLDSCPNEECDDDLEKMVPSLCPQDCARTLKINGHVMEVSGISVTTRGVCYCEHDVSCTCVPDYRHNRTFEYAPVSRCDANCAITITVTLAVSLILIVVLLVLCRWRHRLRNGGMKHVSSMVSISAIPSDYVDDQDRPSGHLMTSIDWSPKMIDPHFESDPKWEIPRSNIHLEHVIGEGEFGRVVKAEAFNIQKQPGPITVAVKMLKECASTAEFRDLLSEYSLLKDVSHRNIIKLLGICSQKGPFLLIVEYCEHGSLRSFLRKSRNLGCYVAGEITDDVIADDEAKKGLPNDVVITAKDCLSFAWQTANGMSYLCNMKLVHRDLATRNLLVASGKIIKISDFGLTRDIYEGDAYLKRSKGRIPVKWMAPESLYDQVYTTKSDVWSFGVVLWEIVTLGATPYPGVVPERLCQLLKTGYRMSKPQGCSNELYSIMQQCWDKDPGNRPTFKHIASLFEDMLNKNTMYLDLTYQPDFQSSEDDVTGGVDQSSVLKANENQNESEYGSINILSTDNNSYVLTPSLQLNGEAMLMHWPQEDRYSNWSNDGKHSLDVSTEETHFLPKNARMTAADETEEDFEKKSAETESLVSENLV